jgi:phenylacetyl-CoA:acceptor oxidoreductase 26-kDa subunit
MSTGPAMQKSWDWRAAGNFIGGGSGSGLMIIGAVLALASDSNFTLVLIATLLIVMGLGTVWLEIGRPWRFLNVYRNPFTSWMSRESYLGTALVPLALTAFWIQSDTLLIFSGLLACLYLYSQARILKAARSITAWRVNQIVPLVITTGLTEGAGVLLIAWIFIADLKASIGLMDLFTISWVLLVVRFLTWIDYKVVLARNVPKQTKRLIQQSHSPYFWFGHVLPAILMFVVLLTNSQVNALVLLTGLCLTLSGWAIKFMIVTWAAVNQGYAIPHSPARGAGEPGPGVKPGWTVN